MSSTPAAAPVPLLPTTFFLTPKVVSTWRTEQCLKPCVPAHSLTSPAHLHFHHTDSYADIATLTQTLTSIVWVSSSPDRQKVCQMGDVVEAVGEFIKTVVWGEIIDRVIELQKLHGVETITTANGGDVAKCPMVGRAREYPSSLLVDGKGVSEDEIEKSDRDEYIAFLALVAFLDTTLNELFPFGADVIDEDEAVLIPAFFDFAAGLPVSPTITNLDRADRDVDSKMDEDGDVDTGMRIDAKTIIDARMCMDGDDLDFEDKIIQGCDVDYFFAHARKNFLTARATCAAVLEKIVSLRPGVDRHLARVERKLEMAVEEGRSTAVPME